MVQVSTVEIIPSTKCAYGAANVMPRLGNQVLDSYRNHVQIDTSYGHVFWQQCKFNHSALIEKFDYTLIIGSTFS
jgi:hypothetical protein